jgi:multidrug efflux pump subunit AcrB
MKRVIAAFARNLVFANILLLTIIFAGGLGAIFMVRELFPEMSVDVILVHVPYLGADPEEIEEGISRKIEEEIETLEGIKRYTTLSAENRATCVVEVKEGYNTDQVKERVRSRVDAISTFPVDAEKPIIEEITLKRPVLSISLWGDLPERTLKETAEKIKEEVQLLSEVSQVEVAGAREYEIAIELSEDRLREYGLTFDEVANAVRTSSLNQPGGTIRGKGEEVRLRTMGRKYTGKDFASIVLRAGPGGELITLDRVAAIDDGFTEDAIIARFDGYPCAVIQVMKTPEEDSIAIRDQVVEWVEKKQQTLPEGVNLSVWNDQSQHIRARIRLLLRNGGIGLVLVFLLLWMFLDIRLSFWAAMGIPISLFGAAAIMWAQGATINMLSLFGLIMVLGIIVDDAIVVGEAIYVHRKSGEEGVKAAVEGVCEVGLPVIAAVTTTIVAFVPLLFVGGVMGKFISILPVAVVSCLTISLVECLILLPAHLSHLPDPNAEIGPGHPWKRRAMALRRGISHSMEWFVDEVYSPFVARVIRWRYVALCVAICVLSLTIGIYVGGIIKYEMFPDISGDEMTASIEFPEGTPLEVTRQAVQQMEAALERVAERQETVSGKPLVEHMFSLAGANLGDDLGNDVGPSYGAVRVELLKSEERGVHSNDLMVDWEDEIGEIPGALALTLTGMDAGPPGSDIEVWVRGDDMDMILAASDDLKEKLKTFDGLYQVQTDFRPGKRELRLQLKPEARGLGLTVASLARQVFAGYYGEEALRLQRGRDDIRVKVRYPLDERSRLSDLDQVRIRTPRGDEVPLLSVADVSFADGYSTISRSGGLRRVVVTAEVDANKTNAQEIMGKLRTEYFPELRAKHPGVISSFEGVQKENADALGSLVIGFPLALLGIFVIIATIFRSYLQPFVIMVTVPFGIVGAVYGHLIMGLFKGGYDLTLMSVFGMVALSGVVVNDAIVLIECVNNMIADGVPFYEALRRGGARRFRAIFLTTVSTVGGLTPMILETDLQAQFLIPMALSIAAGVAFATLLTLLLIPCLLGILNDFRRILYALRHGRWPTHEEVEPAVDRKVDPLASAPGEPTPAEAAK